MDNGILQSIETRQKALYDNFELPNDAKTKAEDFFARMQAFGETCSDQADFEKQLQVSPLNNEYNSLFAEFSKYVKKTDNVPSLEEYTEMVAKDTAKSVVKMQAEQTIRTGIFRILPPSLQRWWVRGVYNIPILGDILSAKNNADQIKRYSGKK